jgi:hypothetical protein
MLRAYLLADYYHFDAGTLPSLAWQVQLTLIGNYQEQGSRVRYLPYPKLT